MPIYKIRDKQTGKIYVIRDNQGYQQPQAQPTTPNNFLPGAERLNQEIGRRTNAIEDLRQEINTPFETAQNFREKGVLGGVAGIVNPSGGGSLTRDLLKIGKRGLMTMGLPFQQLEAGVANAGLEAQKGNLNPLELAKAAKEGITGERPAELGDLGRAVGAPEIVNQTVGFIGSVGLGNLATKGKLVSEVSKTADLTKKQVTGLRQVQRIAKTVKNLTKRKEFAQNVRRQMFGKKIQVGKDFGKAVDDLAEQFPDRKIDLSSQFQFLKDNVDNVQDNPGLRREINSILSRSKDKEIVKLMRDLVDNPDNANNLNLQQVQKIKQAVQNAPSIARKLKQGKFADYTSGDMELLDLLDEIKLGQSEIFPEMAQVRAPYAEYMNNYRVVKNKFKPGSLMRNIREGFGDDEIQDMVQVILPEETFGNIKDFQNTLRGIKIGGGVAVGALAAKEGFDVIRGLRRN